MSIIIKELIKNQAYGVIVFYFIFMIHVFITESIMKTIVYSISLILFITCLGIVIDLIMSTIKWFKK